MMPSLPRWRAAGSVSFKSVGRQGEDWEVRQRSSSDRINKKWFHPGGVIDGLITAGMRCLAARPDVRRTCLEQRDPGRWHPSDSSSVLPLNWWSQPLVPSFMTYNYRLCPVCRLTLMT